VQYIQQNNNRKFLKSGENYAHIGTGSLQNTKQTWPKQDYPMT
jgi:hypothetical protein